jgi:phage/plasmid-like protein (TIGR03299 family)
MRRSEKMTEIVEETQTYADVDQAFSVREVPWMKMGKLVDQPATAAEAAKMSGLDFEVELCEVAYKKSGDDWTTTTMIPKRRAVVAKDNGDFMGFVSSEKYSMLQYAEAFNFMDTISPQYVAAGALKGRRQGFMVVKPEEQISVLGGEDPHELYAVLRTSHDCSRAIEVSVMPLRGRCMNQMTLRSFTKGVDYRWSIKHNTTMHAKLQEAQKSLKKIGLYARRYESLVSRMVETQLKHDQARGFLQLTIPMPNGKTERVEERYKDKINAILNLWETSPTVAYAGTGWGLVNAVSEYYDWYRAGGTAESRFLNALEGETHKRVNKLTGLVLAA